MRFSCDKCSARYSIADEKVYGKLTSVRCIKCGNKIIIDGKALVETDQAQANMQAGWFAIVDRKQLGPLSLLELKNLVGQGKINARTYVWREGQGDWKRAVEIKILEPLISAQDTIVASPTTSDSHTHARSSKQPSAEPIATREKQPSSQGFSAQLSHEDRAGPHVGKADLSNLFFASSPGSMDPGSADDRTEISREPMAPSAADSALAINFGTGISGQTHSAQSAQLHSSQSASQSKDEQATDPVVDPFAQVSEGQENKPVEIGEQTRLFMQEAGVTRRNPLWKKALFLILLLAIPIGMLQLLSRLNVGFLKITTRIDEETGQEIKASVFSSEGLAGLRDLLTGKRKAATVAAKQRAARTQESRASRSSSQDDGKQVIARPKVEFNMSEEDRKRMKDAFAGKEFTDAPKMVGDAIHLDGKGLNEKVVSEVFGKNLKALQACVETEIKRNPSFKGGKIKIVFTIGTSGMVTKASVDRPDIDRSSLGSCLKDRAKRMVFPSFNGEPFDVESPLVLANGA